MQERGIQSKKELYQKLTDFLDNSNYTDDVILNAIGLLYLRVVRCVVHEEDYGIIIEEFKQAVQGLKPMAKGEC